MSQPVIILYDAPSHAPQPWAPNIWRIRFILNYKRLPYRTQWVEFPDIESTLRAINAPPSGVRSDGRPVFSLPVIVDPLRGAVLSNVSTIADYLESTYPARPVFPDGSRAMQALFVHHIQEVLSRPLLPIMIPLSHQRLSERSRTHFRRGGGPSPSAGPPPDQAWGAVREQFNFLAGVLDQNRAPDGDGVVAMGHEVSYADFAVCSVLIWIEQVSPHDGWARIRQWNNGRWLRLWDRCRDYMDVC